MEILRLLLILLPMLMIFTGDIAYANEPEKNKMTEAGAEEESANDEQDIDTKLLILRDRESNAVKEGDKISLRLQGIDDISDIIKVHLQGEEYIVEPEPEYDSEGDFSSWILGDYEIKDTDDNSAIVILVTGSDDEGEEEIYITDKSLVFFKDLSYELFSNRDFRDENGDGIVVPGERIFGRVHVSHPVSVEHIFAGNNEIDLSYNEPVQDIEFEFIAEEGLFYDEQQIKLTIECIDAAGGDCLIIGENELKYYAPLAFTDYYISTGKGSFINGKDSFTIRIKTNHKASIMKKVYGQGAEFEAVENDDGWSFFGYGGNVNNGALTFYIELIDEAGQRISVSEKELRQVIVDRNAPMIDMSVEAYEGSVYNRSGMDYYNSAAIIKVVFNDTDIKSTRIVVNGASYDDITELVINEDGEYLIEIYASDLAGNIAELRRGECFVIDSKKPVLELSEDLFAQSFPRNFSFKDYLNVDENNIMDYIIRVNTADGIITPGISDMINTEDIISIFIVVIDKAGNMSLPLILDRPPTAKSEEIKKPAKEIKEAVLKETFKENEKPGTESGIHNNDMIMGRPGSVLPEKSVVEPGYNKPEENGIILPAIIVIGVVGIVIFYITTRLLRNR